MYSFLYTLTTIDQLRAIHYVTSAAAGIEPPRSLHALRYLPNIRYVVVFRYSHLVFVISIRYSKFFCFFLITLFCAVTNNESNAILRSVRNTKIHSKRMKSLR